MRRVQNVGFFLILSTHFFSFLSECYFLILVKDMAKFLSSEEVEAIHTTDATTPRNPEATSNASTQTSNEHFQQRASLQELIGAEELRGKCRRLSGNSELGWRPSLLGCRPLTFQDASPADSPQHREESHITEHEACGAGHCTSHFLNRC